MTTQTHSVPESLATLSVQPLALRPRDASKALGISERLLWSLTNQNLIPHLRLGSKAIVYPIETLREWLSEQANKGTRT